MSKGSLEFTYRSLKVDIEIAHEQHAGLGEKYFDRGLGTIPCPPAPPLPVTAGGIPVNNFDPVQSLPINARSTIY